MRRDVSRLVLLLTLAACHRPVSPEPPARPGLSLTGETSDTSNRPLTAAPAADLIYFVMVDRFDNGDTSNDGEVNPDDPQAFHGGDLQGVLRRLDYLQELGVGTVWLSPVFEMRTEMFHGWGAFHGYWVRDLTRAEPRFGGLEALEELGDALDARGMRLVLDMVWNHVGFDAPLRETHPHWFHPDQPIEDWSDPVQLETHTVHGLPDLDQSEPEVFQHLLDASLMWARAVGADGLRVDAVRHMSQGFLSQMSEALHAELGEDFWLLGEDFQGDAAALSQSMKQGGFDAMFDFPLRYAMVDTYCGGRPVGRIAATLSADRFYDDPQALVTFLDNHDVSRVSSACGVDRHTVDQAFMFQFFTRGTPSVTYGSELYLEGAEEPDNRADMPWSVVEGSPPQELWVAELARLRAAHGPGVGVPWTVTLTDTLFAQARYGWETGSLLAVNRGAEEALVAAPPPFRGGEWVTHIIAHPEGVDREVPASRIPDDGVIAVPARSTLLLVARSVSQLGMRTAGMVASTPAAVHVQVRATADLKAGERMVLVGSGPELGDWDPARGVALTPDAEGRLVGAFTAPHNVTFAAKLVRLGAGGAATWQGGEDSYYLVEPEAPLLVAWAPEG